MAKLSTLGLPAGFKTTVKPSGTLIMSLRGATGVGKTYTALKTLPGPVVYLNGDRDNDLLLERLMVKFNRDIIPTPRYVLKYQGDIMRGKENLNDNAGIARKIRDRFRTEYIQALESNVRFIVVDQSAWLWSLLRIARWGKLIEIPQILYSQANWEMEQIVHQADDTGKVVIWLSQSEEEWEDYVDQTPNGPVKKRRTTGNFKTIGYKGFDSMMSIVGEMHYDIGENARTIKIIKGIANMGKELAGKDVTLPKLMALGTGVDEESWK